MLAWTAGGAGAQGGGTPLPAGWELCVLEGLASPATPVNVTDLDEWQAAEGGSTNNTAAFNPFNTGRTIDVTGAPIPGVVPSSNGFPAFPNWPAGCSATVATLLQPNMWAITVALRSGNVTPPPAFLAVVDQTPWCAPSNGVPCYASTVFGVAGSLPVSLPVSSALDVYGNVTSDLRSYQQFMTSVAADQGLLTSRDQALAATEVQVTTARGQLAAASKALQEFAVSEYVSSGLYSSAPLVNSDGPQPLTAHTPRDEDGVVVQQYLGVAAANLVGRDTTADEAVKHSLHQRDDAANAVTQAAVTLASDQAAENQSLDLLVKDVATLEHAGVCSTVTITAPSPSGQAPTAAASTPATLVPTTTTTSSTTTTTVPPTVPTTTVPTTVPTTTVTSTIPSNTMTTAVPTTTVPTTTVPTTVPTTAPATVPSSTVPTTVPAPTAPNTPPAAAAPGAVPAGVTALQGCIAPLAPAT